MGICPLPASIYTTFAGHRSTCTSSTHIHRTLLLFARTSCNQHHSKIYDEELTNLLADSYSSLDQDIAEQPEDDGVPTNELQNKQLTLEGTSSHANLPNYNPNLLPSTLPCFLQDDSAVTYSYFSTYRTSQVRVASFVNSFRSQVPLSRDVWEGKHIEMVWRSTGRRRHVS